MTAISTPINRRTVGVPVPRFALVAFAIVVLAVAAVFVAVAGPDASGRASAVNADPGSVSAPISSEYLRSVSGSWTIPGAGAGAGATTFDAPYYSEYVQDMARGW